MAEAETLTLVGARWKYALIVLGSVAFVLIGWWMIHDLDGTRRYSAEMTHFFGWVSMVFFGFCGLIGLSRVVFPSRLVLTPEGFELHQFPRVKRVRWDSVDQFFVWSMAANRMASWTYRPGAPEAGAMAAINRGFGADGSVGTGWPRSPEAIVDLMNGWKSRFVPETEEAAQARRG